MKPFILSSLIALTLGLGNSSRADDENFREIKFNVYEETKSDEWRPCLLKLAQENLQRLGGSFKDIKINEKIEILDISALGRRVWAKYPIPGSKFEAKRNDYRNELIRKTGFFWNGYLKGTLYRIPAQFESEGKSRTVFVWVRANWDRSSTCRLEFPSKKGSILASVLKLPKELFKGAELDAFYISDFDHTIYAYVDATKTARVSKLHRLD